MEYRLNVKSDIYCEKDLLGFDKYIDTLSKMVTDKDFKTPFCIGIFGKWGSGKTSFMHLLEKRLSGSDSEPHAVPVWFNPWRYEKEEHLIIPFLKTIEHEIRRYEKEHKAKGKKWLGKILNAGKKIGEASAALAYGMTLEAKLGGFGFTLDTSKAVEREEGLAQRKIEEAKTLAEKLSSIYYEIVGELKGAVDEKSFRIVVFIDDLDRCLPDKAVELLEAIKLFLDIEGYLFIIGVDREVVKKGISYRYRFFEHREEKERDNLIISPEDYLDKMIQLPLELPAIEHGRKITFIENLVDGSEEFKKHARIIEMGIGDNPRTLKRFTNLLAFTVSLAETVKESIIHDSNENVDNKDLLQKHFIPLQYIKWTVIVFRYPKIHNDIKGNKKLLIELQKAAREEEKTENIAGEKAEKTGIQLDGRLKNVLKEGDEFPDNDWLIERFIHLTESTVISAIEGVEARGFSSSYKPGDMVLIPKGKFLYGDDKMEDTTDDDFEIDVFLVTNKQYKEFIDATNREVPYSEVEREKPYNWDRMKRTYPEGLDDHPVVLISYEDAMAFCEWRSKKEGKTSNESYRLPTEKEWEKAARGEKGRAYPWGDDFDFRKVNYADYHVKKMLKDSRGGEEVFKNDFYEKNKGKALTTPVGNFPEGASPYGCMDMAGNVWEWTGSWYDNTETERVVRGGSWDDGGDYCRCAFRDRGNPNYRHSYVGFRCARTLKL